MRNYIDIVFADGEISDAVFVEVEDEHGYSIRVGEWVTRPDGYSALRLTPAAFENDPTRYCNACGARRREQCKCTPIAANE